MFVFHINSKYMKYYVRHNTNKTLIFCRFFIVFGCIFTILGTVVLSRVFLKKDIAVDFDYYLLYSKDENFGVEARAFDCFFSGGAGVAFSYQKEDYVIMAAYPDFVTAEKIAKRESGGVIKIGIKDIKKSVFCGESYYVQIKNNVNILKQCISLSYDTANALEKGDIGGYAARYNVLSLVTVLKSLVSDNIYLGFSDKNTSILECVKFSEMFFSENVNSSEIRRMQIELIFTLLSFEKKFIFEKII